MCGVGAAKIVFDSSEMKIRNEKSSLTDDLFLTIIMVWNKNITPKIVFWNDRIRVTEDLAQI